METISQTLRNALDLLGEALGKLNEKEVAPEDGLRVIAQLKLLSAAEVIVEEVLDQVEEE